MSIPLDLALLKDVILLLISGIACLYCVLLNRRLKGLNDLKSGVGASIVSLTKAIKETHKAATAAQSSTVESIDILKDLLDKSNEASLRMEAETIALQRNVKRAIAVNAGLQVKVQTDLPEAIQKAQATASNLLKVVADIEKHRSAQEQNLHSEAEDAASSSKAATAKASHLKVVEKPAEINEAITSEPDTTEANIGENSNILAQELSQHLEDLEDAEISESLVTDNIEDNVVPVKDEIQKSVKDEDSAPVLTAEKTEEAIKTVSQAPILQRIPPLGSVATTQEQKPATPTLENVTELNAFEKRDDNKDPIDELFDNIDHLVKQKGVSKGMGILKSREYYKS